MLRRPPTPPDPVIRIASLEDETADLRRLVTQLSQLPTVARELAGQVAHELAVQHSVERQEEARRADEEWVASALADEWTEVAPRPGASVVMPRRVNGRYETFAVCSQGIDGPPRSYYRRREWEALLATWPELRALSTSGLLVATPCDKAMSLRLAKERTNGRPR